MGGLIGKLTGSAPDASSIRLAGALPLFGHGKAAAMERNTRWALLAVALVGGLSVAAVQLVTAHGSKASDENLREVSGRIDAVRMANWHAEASAGAAKTSGPIPRDAIGADWLDPNGFFASAADGSGRVVTWFQGSRSEWPQIAKGLSGFPRTTVGRTIRAGNGPAFETQDGSIVRLPAGINAPEGAPAITGKAH